MATRRRFIQTAALSCGGILATPAVLRAQEKFQWQAQCLWGPSELTYKAFEDFCKRVGTLTDGQLEITPNPGGAIVGVFETLDALQAGILEAHSTYPGYFTGKDAGFAVASDFVFGYEAPWQAAAWYYERGGLDVLRKLYEPFGCYTVNVGWWGVESLVSKRPLKSVADFKGLKVRSPQGMTAEILTKMGASGVVLPGGEVYSALDKGVVDAADWGTVSMNDKVGLFETAKYSVTIYHSMPVQDFTVNKAAWDKLPKNVQAILATAVREWGCDQILRVAQADATVGAKLKSEQVSLNVWKGEPLRQIRSIARDTWKDWSTRSPLAKEAYDGQHAWLTELGLVG